MSDWSFLTNHGRALLYIAAHPDARLRDVADSLGVTERTVFGIVTDLADAGYVIKERDGRRNRYQIQHDLTVPTGLEVSRERTVGDLLGLFVDGGDPTPP